MADTGTSSPPPAPASPPAPATSYSFDDAPLNRFHLKVTALTFGANFSDGYQLGVIGIALTLMAPQMGLGAVWQGMLGASALIGSIALGWLADRIGRQI
ncbi:hypothetical protein ABZY02_01905 [Streptomyces sp. NPDC006649]|uniref:hypothetical protein n=1 Tax=Streptomyces sp. NPDC006649 TaxID=3156896 RepID=UPI0033AC1BD9